VDFLEQTLAMKGGSARPLILFLKRTGFLRTDGTPTDRYKRFRNPTSRGRGRGHRVDAGITIRSEALIDFTNFGDLSEIIANNWDIFGATFSSQLAVRGVMSRLHSLRGPIAKCSPLADDEVNRLQISVRDWFRLMS
jgi:hypothetical protein